MLLATALAYLLQDVLNRRLLFKTNRQQWHKNHHPIISSFLELGEENCRCSGICGGAENVKTGNPANVRKWIARFYYFRHLYSAGSAGNVCSQ